MDLNAEDLNWVNRPVLLIDLKRDNRRCEQNDVITRMNGGKEKRVEDVMSSKERQPTPKYYERAEKEKKPTQSNERENTDSEESVWQKVETASHQTFIISIASKTSHPWITL